MTTLEPDRKPRFPMGTIKVTAQARAVLTEAEIRRALARHGQGDRGLVDEETKAENEGGIGYPRLAICSRYVAGKGGHFWVMTQPERQQTMVTLGTLPEFR